MLPASSLGVALSGLSEAALSSESKARVGLVLQTLIALFCSTSASHGATRDSVATSPRTPAATAAARGKPGRARTAPAAPRRLPARRLAWQEPRREPQQRERRAAESGE